MSQKLNSNDDEDRRMHEKALQNLFKVKQQEKKTKTKKVRVGNATFFIPIGKKETPGIIAYRERFKEYKL